MEVRFEADMVENGEAFYHMNYAHVARATTKRRRIAYFVLLALAIYVAVNQTFFMDGFATSRELGMLWGLVILLGVGGFFYTKKDAPLGEVVNKRLLQMCLSAEAGKQTKVHYVFCDDKFRAESPENVIEEGYGDIKRLAVTPAYLLMFMGKKRIHTIRLDSVTGGENSLEELKAFLMEKTGKTVDRVPMLSSQKKKNLFGF